MLAGIRILPPLSHVPVNENALKVPRRFARLLNPEYRVFIKEHLDRVLFNLYFKFEGG